MIVQVYEHYGDVAPRRFEGAETEVRKDLIYTYPFLAHKLGGEAGLTELVRELNKTQAFSAKIQDGDLVLHDFGKSDTVGALLGSRDAFEAALAAAAFLAGDPNPPDCRAARAAYVAGDEDPERAALFFYKVPATEANLAALRAVATLETLHKATPDLEHAMAATDDGKATAASVQRAIQSGQIREVQLGGKHSKGSIIARDPKEHTSWLLKPGSGAQNPAAGDSDTSTSQSKREAAFYQVALLWGLGNDIPECHLVLIDGREYAAMRLLGHDYQNGNQWKDADPTGPRRLLHLYLGDGHLHRWAALDFVTGNVDRNAGNVMVRGDDVKLIDHGSAFAGTEFNPSDPATFVPWYLRTMAGNWTSGDAQQNYKALPRLHSTVAEKFKTWLLGLDPFAMEAILRRYGIPPEAEIARLQKLQRNAAVMPADAAVNSAWTLG